MKFLRVVVRNLLGITFVGLGAISFIGALIAYTDGYNLAAIALVILGAGLQYIALTR